MTNNAPDYEDNLYFATSQSPRNHLATKPQAVDLTEQWKKGELPQDAYYVIYYKNDTPEVDIYRTVYRLHKEPKVGFTIDQVVKVLAPVPSYDEWKTSSSIKESALEEIKRQEMTINRLVSSGKQKSCDMFKLKELLKEAEKQIIAYKNNDTLPERAFYEKDVEELLTKIDEALK